MSNIDATSNQVFVVLENKKSGLIGLKTNKFTEIKIDTKQEFIVEIIQNRNFVVIRSFDPDEEHEDFEIIKKKNEYCREKICHHLHQRVDSMRIDDKTKRQDMDKLVIIKKDIQYTYKLLSDGKCEYES